jgi:hypothetical protein
MSADFDREAVYAAERAAFDGTDLEAVRPLNDVRSLAARVVDGTWWPGPPVAVRAARSDAMSSSARSGRENSGAVVVIRIAPPQCTVATVAHELAHALAGVEAGHDATYRRAALDAVEVITNLDTTDRRGPLHAQQLSAAYESAGLDVGARRWPPPSSGISGPIAL